MHIFAENHHNGSDWVRVELASTRLTECRPYHMSYPPPLTMYTKPNTFMYKQLSSPIFDVSLITRMIKLFSIPNATEV